MRCPFFLSKNPFWNQKRHLVLRHYHVYTIYLFFDMCFLFLSCVGLSHPKYMFSGFLLYVVFSASFYRNKCINSKNVSLEITIKKPKFLQKKGTKTGYSYK